MVHRIIPVRRSGFFDGKEKYSTIKIDPKIHDYAWIQFHSHTDMWGTVDDFKYYGVPYKVAQSRFYDKEDGERYKPTGVLVSTKNLPQALKVIKSQHVGLYWVAGLKKSVVPHIFRILKR